MNSIVMFATVNTMKISKISVLEWHLEVKINLVIELCKKRTATHHVLLILVKLIREWLQELLIAKKSKVGLRRLIKIIERIIIIWHLQCLKKSLNSSWNINMEKRNNKWINNNKLLIIIIIIIVHIVELILIRK
jgi:hypothetical protein